MAVWLTVSVILAILVISGGMIAISRLYKTPQVPHRKTPASLDIPFEEIRFPTTGGKELYGWWIPASGTSAAETPTLILVHGWRRNVERLLPFVREFAPSGYNLLVFDARNHGSSDSDGHATMLKFAQDIQAAVDEALRRPEVRSDQLGVFALSIGGAAAIYAAAHDSRIRTVVTVGAFAHPGDIMRQDLIQRGVPTVAIPAIMRYVERQVGARLDDIAPERQIASLDIPVLLIHGEEDIVIPPEHGRRLAAAADNSTLWAVPGQGHSDCDRHAEFWPIVIGFLKSAFSPSGDRDQGD